MKRIIPATLEFLSFITGLLSRDYQKMNAALERSFYQTDEERLEKYVKECILKGTDCQYFVMVDEGGIPIGYIVLLVGKRAEILMLGVRDEQGANELIEELVKFGITSLKESGAEYITFEVAPYEELYRNILEKYNAKSLVSRFVL